MPRPRTVVPRVSCLLALIIAARASADEAAEGALRALAAKVPGWRVVALPADGELVLTPDQALTVAALRGVPLDDDPPVLGTPAQPYPANMTDDYPPGQAPYVADGIAPFRFRYFHCEFSYGGWHNWAMTDYAATRGFDILASYNHQPADWTHVPAGTVWLKWAGFVNWDKWLPEHGFGEGRYDQLAALDLAGMLREAGTFAADPQYQSLMIDMEHGVLPPDKLREQEWYPQATDAAARAAFERRYYDGYAKTYIAPVEVAREAGWKNVSLYGWQPFARTFWGIDKVQLDPATDWAWNRYGKAIYEAVDILNPSVYCFYEHPGNVAYTLANIDLNRRLVGTMPERKPIRPYYWTLLHGGGSGWRWWAGQPLADEDVRAMTALCFFTGCDGFVTWNWSGTGNHHRPDLKPEADVMVGRPFEATAAGSDQPAAFRRYDALHIQAIDEDDTIRFQRIEKGNAKGHYGIAADRPVYALPRDELAAHLRVASEPVAAMIEGMALVKPLEYLLRHGEVKVDVSAQRQFAELLPIVRRVKLGNHHVVATYDPQPQDPPRVVVLEDFDGRAGLTVRLPADAETRVFVLRGP